MVLRLGIGVAGLLVYLVWVFVMGASAKKSDNIRNKLDKIKQGNTLRSTQEISGSFARRVFVPAYEKAVHFLSTVIPLSRKSQDQLTETLRSAGVKKSAREYIAGMAVIYLLMGAAILFTSRVLAKKSVSDTVLYLLFALFLLYTVARFLMSKRVTQRTENINNELPEILDLLSVSVSAGLGFDQALQYVVDRCEGELAEELAVTQREISLGKSRNAALKSLADRGKAESLRMFVSAVIQADTMGIAISNILQVQADNARQQHRQHIEEKAAKLPVKVLIPLVFCIFPIMFIILLGPAVPKVMAAF